MKFVFRKISAWVIAAFVFVLAFPVGVSASETIPEKNILIINQFTAEHPAHQLFNEGVTNALLRESGYTFNFAYEYLNMDKFPDNDAYLEATAQYLSFKQKYSNWRPDVIIASDGVADFLYKYGNDIFGDTPIVVVWAGDGQKPVNLQSEHVTLSAFVDYKKNIELINNTLENLEQVYVVIGHSESEQSTLEQIKKVALLYADKIDFIYLNQLSHQQMLDMLRNPSDRSAVLFVRWIQDAEGKAFIPVNVLEEIIKEVNIPVFGVHYQFLGSGIVGGYVYDQALIGNQAAQSAIQMMKGIKLEDLVIESEQSHKYTVDWRALKHWDIAEDKLPLKSTIFYKEENIWHTYGKYVVFGGLIIVIETILMAGLITNHGKRMKAENALISLNSSLERLIGERTQELTAAKVNLEKLNKRLDFTSRVDTLTGLYNRRHIQECLDKEYENFTKNGQLFSIIIADIDNFKQINDLYGHDAGDMVLKELSNRVLEQINDYGVAARWGGEEFLLLLPQLSPADAEKQAEAIRSAVEKDPFLYSESPLFVTVTMGLATISEQETIRELIKRADKALYKGKTEGKNRIVVV